MTKKDYEKFAELLSTAIAYKWDAKAITLNIAYLFASENENFDSAKFGLAIEKQVSRNIIGSSGVNR
jgi:hypothetical protein